MNGDKNQTNQVTQMSDELPFDFEDLEPHEVAIFKSGIDAGEENARRQVRDLINECLEAYESIGPDDDPEKWYTINDIHHTQANAVRFVQNWVSTGGCNDLDGNRICLPW